MHEFRPELERRRHIRLAARQNPAADSIACFEQTDTAAVPPELDGSCEAGRAGADDRDVVPARHRDARKSHRSRFMTFVQGAFHRRASLFSLGLGSHRM
jgi:hypothetical protein